MSGKVFPFPPLLSSVRSVRESYGREFGRFEGVAEMGRLYPVDAVDYFINLQWCRKSL